MRQPLSHEIHVADVEQVHRWKPSGWEGQTRKPLLPGQMREPLMASVQ